MSDFISPGRIASLKSGIESKTGGSYADLTAGVQALMNGYGQGSSSGGSTPVLEELTVTANGEYTPGAGVDGFSKVTVAVEGGASVTFLDCVTIMNDEEHGYENGILLPVALSDINKAEINAKIHTTGNHMWLCAWLDGPNSPYWSFTDAFADENELVNVSVDVSNTKKYCVKIGGWKDSGYSKTITYYGVSMYDANGEYLANLKPALNSNNEPGFYDEVSGNFLKNIMGTSFVAGEPV